MGGFSTFEQQGMHHIRQGNNNIALILSSIVAGSNGNRLTGIGGQDHG